MFSDITPFSFLKLTGIKKSYIIVYLLIRKNEKIKTPLITGLFIFNISLIRD